MLYQRILTGVLGGAIFLGLVFTGGYAFLFFITVLALVAYSELLKMKNDPYISLQGCIGYALVLVLLYYGLQNTPYLLLGMYLLLFVPVITKNRLVFTDVSYYALGAFYIGLSLHAALQIRLHFQQGLFLFLFVLLCIWMTDTLAFFVGGLLKGPKLWPTISPKKTISGALGGMLGAIVIGVLFYLGKGYGHSLWQWVLVALGISIVGQIGDLVESAIKRSMHVKDSGTLLPGHGGVLDRFDSFLFAAPFAYYVFEMYGFLAQDVWMR